MEIEIVEGRCVGAGECAWIAPTVFTQRESDGLVLLLKARPGPDEAAFAREAAMLCPTRAIRIIESANPKNEDPKSENPARNSEAP